MLNMKKYILAACAAALLTITDAQAQATLTGDLTTDSTLAEYTCYYLDGCFVVKTGNTLTIEAGVTVLAKPASSLVVEPGAQLIVNGTATDRVVFTSAEDPGDRQPGDWYGIVIGGYSYTNNGPLDMGACTNVTAGGNLPADNSGEIRYLEVHYAGGNTDLMLDNALTLNALGSSTIVENVQVSNSATNNFGIYGGTVNLQSLFSLDARKSDVFISDGYTGSMQYLLAIRRDATAFHATEASYGIYIQNNYNTPTFAGTPLTAPVISNATIIGPDACNDGPFGGDFRDAVRFADNGGGSIYNSVLTGWPGYGLFIDGNQSVAHTATNTLNFSFNSFYNNGSPYGSSTWMGGCSGNMASWIGGTGLSCLEDGNQTSATDPAYNESLCGDYCDELFVPEFVIDEESTELEAPDFSWPGGDTWFDDDAAYRGAIQAGDLYTGWSDLCPSDRMYCQQVRLRAAPEQSGIRIVPNPAQGTAYALFDAGSAGTVRIQVLDPISGQALHNTTLRTDAGTQRITLPASDLRAGVYVVKITLPGGRVLTSQLFVL
jgi:hypothetical protein